MKNNQPKSERGGWPRHVVFDRAFPLSESAAAGADRDGMSSAELLGAVLITELQGRADLSAPVVAQAIAHVRAAVALAQNSGESAKGRHQ